MDTIAEACKRQLTGLEFQMQTATTEQLLAWAETDTIAALFANKHLTLRNVEAR